MDKFKKILMPVTSAIVLIGVVLKMYGINDYNSLFLYFFIAEGLMLLALELGTKVVRKPLMKIILILIPILVIAMAIQGIFTNNYPFASILISTAMYFLISERFALSTRKA